MKFPLCLFALCLTLSLVHADLVVEQKMESPVMNGVVTMKTNGTMARIEIPSPIGQTISIFDVAKGKITILMTGQKVAMEVDAAALKTQAAALQKSGAAGAKPTATGAKKKIGEWDAEEYTLTAQGVTMRLWIAPNFPDGKALSQELAKLSQAMGSGLPDPNAFGLPGVVVQSEMETPIGKVSSTLQSVKHTPVDPSEFVVPEGYKVTKAPPGLGGEK